LLHGVGAEIRDYELMSAAHQAPSHVRTHAPQPHHSQLHASLLSSAGVLAGCREGVSPAHPYFT